MAGRRGKVQTPAYVVFALSVIGFAVLMVAGGIVEARDDASSWWPGALVLIALVALAWRTTQFSVVVADDIVQVRNLLTHRLPRREVTDLQMVDYSGWWHGIGTSQRVVTLVVVAGDREVTALGLLGRRSTMGRVQTELRSLIGLPAPPAKAPGHRSAPGRHRRPADQQP